MFRKLKAMSKIYKHSNIIIKNNEIDVISALNSYKEDLYNTKKQILKDKSINKDIHNYNSFVCSFLHKNLDLVNVNAKFYSIKDKDTFEEIPKAAILWGEQPLEENIRTVDYAWDLL